MPPVPSVVDTSPAYTFVPPRGVQANFRRRGHWQPEQEAAAWPEDTTSRLAGYYTSGVQVLALNLPLT